MQLGPQTECPDCGVLDTGTSQASGGFLGRLLDTSSFPPRWHCGEWETSLGWLHIGSDVATWLAYTTIPVMLLLLLRRKGGDLPMPGLLGLFSAFILFCGFEHLLEAVIFWWPAYRLAGWLKLCTAVVSVVTVGVLGKALPHLLQFRSPQELESEVRTRTHELETSQAQLQEARLRAETADAAKSRFLATMSHELRTPIAAILGGLDVVLEDTQLTEDEREERLRSVHRNAQHQLGLLQDVLELSRIEAGSLELEQVPLRLEDVQREALDIVAGGARERGIELRAEFRGEERPFLGDPLRLRQVLINLLANALRFTPEGSVVVRGSVEPVPEGLCVSVEVQDTGVGMTADQLERVFEPFQQGGVDTARRYGGSGLGLSISRRLVERMGGLLVARSVPGEGSAFRLRFVAAPAAPVPTTDQGPEGDPREALEGLRVLLAEDHPDLAALTRHQLRRAGLEVTHAADGGQALEVFEEGCYDLALLDLRMPVLGGLEVARTLRQRGWDGHLIALTADAFEHTRRLCRAAGFDDCVSKPVRAEDLLRTLARHVCGGPRPAGSQNPDGRGARRTSGGSSSIA